MAGFLTTSSVLMCPHGGTVTVTPASTRCKAVGSVLACVSDTFLVTGCPLNVAGAPHPCVQLQWIVFDRASNTAAATLTEASVGLCVAADGAPQGGVLITAAQAAADGL